MANAGRSRRCYRCKQRKVKCDEQRPSCGTCIQRGETCPGYAPSFEFRHEYDKPSDSPAAAAAAAHPPNQASNDSASPPPPTDLAKRRRQRDLVLVHYGGGSRTFIRPPPASSKAAAALARTPIADMPNDPTNRLRKSLVYLMDPRMPLNVRLDHYGAMFLDKLPAHLGNSSALDAAVDTFCLWHRNYVGMEKDEVKFLKSQARALSTLRADLASTALCKKSETLCAAVILAGIQSFVSKGHKDGIYALLRYRGPPKPRDPDFDFYESLVLSAQGLAWNKALEDGIECFLNAPEWQRTIRNALDASKPLGRKYGIAAKASPLISRFPGMLKAATDLLATCAPSFTASNDPAAAALAADLHAWRADVLRPEPALRAMQDPIYAALGLGPPARPLDPSNTEVAAYLCSFVAGLSVTRRVLRMLDAQTGERADPLTRCDFDVELAVASRLATLAFSVLQAHNVPSLPYLQATLGALVESTHALDGRGSWLDMIRPVLPEEEDEDDMDALFSEAWDPALDPFGGAYTQPYAFEELTSARPHSPYVAV